MTDVNESEYGPAALTFVAVSKAEDGGQHEIAAIRVVDEKSFQIEDILNVRLPVSLGRPAGSMPPTVMPEACARALSHILKNSTLAAWDPEQVIADLDEVLGDASKLLVWDGEQPLDLASLARPFLHGEGDLRRRVGGSVSPGEVGGR